MSWTAIVFTVLILGLVLGPITALMPSRYQRRVAQMRSRATTLGLQVRLVDLSKINGESRFGSLATYGLAWTGSDPLSAKRLPAWQLIRGEMSHDIHFSGVWDWSKSSMKAESRWHAPLKKLIEMGEGDALFAQIKVFEQSPQGFMVYWTERAEIEAVDRIDALLRQFKAFALQQSNNISWPRAITATPTDPIDQD